MDMPINGARMKLADALDAALEYVLYDHEYVFALREAIRGKRLAKKIVRFEIKNEGGKPFVCWHFDSEADARSFQKVMRKVGHRPR
jgi:hypothetical protein